MLRVCVFGSGGWGTALAQLCASRGYRVTQWVREPEVLKSINEQHLNPLFLPDVPLSPHIVATLDEREALEESGYQVRAVKLVGVYDANRTAELRFNHAFKLVFLCELLGGEAAESYETTEVGWFDWEHIPQPFSGTRTNQRHLDDVRALIADPDRPTVFD